MRSGSWSCPLAGEPPPTGRCRRGFQRRRRSAAAERDLVSRRRPARCLARPARGVREVGRHPRRWRPPAMSRRPRPLIDLRQAGDGRCKPRRASIGPRQVGVEHEVSHLDEDHCGSDAGREPEARIPCTRVGAATAARHLEAPSDGSKDRERRRKRQHAWVAQRDERRDGAERAESSRAPALRFRGNSIVEIGHAGDSLGGVGSLDATLEASCRDQRNRALQSCIARPYSGFS
jgi:hypothetical protein